MSRPFSNGPLLIGEIKHALSRSEKNSPLNRHFSVQNLKDHSRRVARRIPDWKSHPPQGKSKQQRRFSSPLSSKNAAIPPLPACLASPFASQMEKAGFLSAALIARVFVSFLHSNGEPFYPHLKKEAANIKGKQKCSLLRDFLSEGKLKYPAPLLMKKLGARPAPNHFAFKATKRKGMSSTVVFLLL